MDTDAQGKVYAATYVQLGLPCVRVQHTVPDGGYGVCIHLSSLSPSLRILNVYYPQRADTGTWVDAVDSDVNNWLVVGDFNLRSLLWEDDCPRQYEASATRDRLVESDLVILNDGSLTRIPDVAGHLPSAVDLSVASAGFAGQVEWETGPDPLGSDHLPIIITSVSGVLPAAAPVAESFNYSKADWNLFRAEIEKTPPIDVGGTPVDELAQYVTDTIINAASAAIPVKRKGAPRTRNNPWWNQACEEAVKSKRKTYNLYRRCCTAESHKAMVEAKVECKRVVAQAKVDYWRNYVESMNGAESLSKVWKKIKKMKQQYNPADSPLSDGDRVLVTAEEKAAAFANTFSKVSSNSHLPQDMKLFRRQYESKTEFVDPIPDNTLSYNSPITMHEIDRALASIKKVSVKEGGDRVTYRMLRELPVSFKGVLLALYQKCWEHGLPAMWKHSIVTPIPKAGKPRTQVDNFRPISLSSHVGKLLERIVKARLEYLCEKQNVIPVFQAGFRRGRGVTDHVVRLASHVRKAYRKRRPLYACFFDLHRAYDTVWHRKLLEKVKALGVSGHMFSFIKDFLANRSYQVRWRGVMSQTYNADMGVPQGLVIAPLLFSIMLSGIGKVDTKGATMTLYADDLAIWKQALFRNACNRKNRLYDKTNRVFQQVIHNIARYMHQNGFVLSPSKTVFIVFAKSRIPPDLSMKVGNQHIKPSIHAKYLGVWFSRNGTWSKHVSTNVESTFRALGLLRTVMRSQWGSQPRTLVRLAVALIRSRLLYGLEGAFNMSKTDLKKLGVADARAFKIALGLPRATPQCLTYREAGILPLADQIRLNCSCYFYRCMTVPNSTTSQELEDHPEAPRAAKKKTFQDYVAPLVDQAGVLGARVAARPLHPYPPWLMERAVIVTGIGNLSKGDNPTLTGTLAREFIDLNYRHSLQIFTDGSLADDSAGAAFYIPALNTSRNYSLPKVSIFTAELLAISMALQHVNDLPVVPHNIVVLTDSKSGLMALQSDSGSSRDDLIREIGVVIHQLIVKGVGVTLQWVPSHVGIPGNEVVDRLAKEASKRATPDLNLVLSYSDIKCKLRSAAWELWKADFSRAAAARRYDLDLTPPQKGGLILPIMPRHLTTIVHRLRCDVWRTIFVPKKCLCGAAVSPHHAIFRCPLSKELFNPLIQRLKTENLAPTLSSLACRHDRLGWELAVCAAQLLFKSPAAPFL
jgi:ribonuclease HI